MLYRDVTPMLADIKAPSESFESLKYIFEQSLAHEKYITERIGKIASLALQEGNHATYQFILWYVEEQIEEESSISDILQKITPIGLVIRCSSLWMRSWQREPSPIRSRAPRVKNTTTLHG